MTLTMNAVLEAKLRKRAAEEGREANELAERLLHVALEGDDRDLEEAVEGIQRGLDDFEAARFRSFNEFAAEQRAKYRIPSAR